MYDPLTDNRENIAHEISTETGKTIIRPYDDEDIIAGQGTAGKEIVEDLLKLHITPDIYLCCCGGGGLIAGTSIYLKYQFPNIKCYSVEPEEFNDTQVSLSKKKITSIKEGSQSFCDALLAPQPGEVTFEINKQTLKEGLSVSDNEVKKTIILLAENLKIIAEPGGAVAATAPPGSVIILRFSANKIIVFFTSLSLTDNPFFKVCLLIAKVISPG